MDTGKPDKEATMLNGKGEIVYLWKGINTLQYPSRI
jgi:hypothetical protein